MTVGVTVDVMEPLEVTSSVSITRETVYAYTAHAAVLCQQHVLVIDGCLVDAVAASVLTTADTADDVVFKPLSEESPDKIFVSYLNIIISN